MFVLLPWLRSCIWLISYDAADTTNCCQHDNGGEIKIPIHISNFDWSKIPMDKRSCQFYPWLGTNKSSLLIFRWIK
jgi:hypothetical protein